MGSYVGFLLPGTAVHHGKEHLRREAGALSSSVFIVLPLARHLQREILSGSRAEQKGTAVLADENPLQFLPAPTQPQHEAGMPKVGPPLES